MPAVAYERFHSCLKVTRRTAIRIERNTTVLQFRKYNDRNFEIRNKHTRERMARLRLGLSPEERAARLLAPRESDRQYRQKNRATIADKAKYHRQAAAAKKEELRSLLVKRKWPNELYSFKHVAGTPEPAVLAILLLM
ncbi:hypothetical protein FB45DRAFT_879895 [Roridomyces roridus]|uniref:Uncharacterized protein n=1 Tax=Roridomyces roridus TaxID=1738132 RepID=A0AAD7F8G6_9AGAR|nr:hypothetical protein FB45DRAFT_879895 [Roridomyces roridus]